MDQYRGTGRTQRMLEEVQRHSGDAVVYAHTYDYAFQLCQRFARMLEGEQFQRTRDTVTRADGRRIRFTSAEDRARHRPGCATFTDHFVRVPY